MTQLRCSSYLIYNPEVRMILPAMLRHIDHVCPDRGGILPNELLDFCLSFRRPQGSQFISRDGVCCVVFVDIIRSLL